MNVYSFAIFCFAFCSFFTGVLVWLRRQDSAGRIFLIFSLNNAAFGIFFAAFLLRNNPYDEALFLVRSANYFAVIVPATWLHFCLSFCKLQSKKWEAAKFIAYLVSFCIASTAFSPLFIPFIRPLLSFAYYATAGVTYNAFVIYFVMVVLIGFGLLIFKTMHASATEKKQYFGFIVSTAVAYTGAGLTFFPVYGFEFPQYGMLLMPSYPFVMAYYIMQGGLFDEERMAAAAHKDKLAALGILTASINHEIRAPLFVIRGTMEMESQNDKLNSKVLAQVDRITGIVSRLTHFAKKGVEEEAKIEAIDLKEILSDIRPLFQHQLNYQSIEYSQETPNDLPKVMADRRYLEEILFNLILNACQAVRETKDPKIKLTASRISSNVKRGRGGLRDTSYVSRDASEIEILISDNGPGIAPDQQKNIFKPFHTTKSEGTGLGLYITRQLVEKCGGKIEVQSELGKGASFSLIFRAI